MDEKNSHVGEHRWASSTITPCDGWLAASLRETALVPDPIRFQAGGLQATAVEVIL